MFKALACALAVNALETAEFVEGQLENLVEPNATYGVDISQLMSVSIGTCLKNAGYNTIIVRGYCSYGAVDSNVCSSLQNAQSAGIANRDVYMFPCPTCSTSAASQVSALVSYLTNNCNSAWSKKIWLDIEGSQYWYSSTTTNRSWYQALKDACVSHSGVSCGIYSSYYQWESIFGSTSYAYGSNLPLWYAHYDNSKVWTDFVSFGGWTTPAVKQYTGDATVCGMGVDLDMFR